MEINRHEALNRLIKLQGEALGPEVHHVLADDVLCAFLRHLGYGDVVDEYEKVEKWYA